MENRHQIEGSTKMDLIVHQIFVDLLCRHPALKKRGKKVLLEKWQAFHIVFLELVNVPLLVDFLIKGFFDPAKKLLKLSGVNGF